jgi:imidazole glycerol-phosphate synthase subunit HisH
LSNNKIVIIDYNMGNLRSVQKAFEKVKCDVVISNNHAVIKTADKIVLPGVGAFKDGMKNLAKLGLIDILNKEVTENKKPFLGVCLGMQLIANKSYEKGESKGLAWVDAEVVKFNFSNSDKKLKIPHVGWNNVNYKNDNKLLKDIPNNSDFYFVHSYYFKTNEDIVTSTTDYGIDFVSSIKKNNIYAFQFHPEKSQQVGLQIIENFKNLKKS